MPETSLLILLGLGVVGVLQVILLMRPVPADPAVAGLQAALGQQAAQLGALDGAVRAELTRQAADLSREISGFAIEQTRSLNAALARQDTLMQALAPALTKQLGQDAEAMRARLEAMDKALATAAAAEMARLRDLIDVKSNESRSLVDAKLREMREANDLKLAEMQRVVNEQLQSAVEKQMNESFNRVIDQFTAIQQMMGNVQAVASQVGDLKRLFGNVKARGGWGEGQVRALLEDILPAGTWETNVRLREDSLDVVEFTVIMPAQGGQRAALAVDAKFPTEDYDRILLASEAADGEAERNARSALERRIRAEAAKIAAKYICPPRTVEFAVMYLPNDGLYAEVARIPGLTDEIGRLHRVFVLGPSLLPAMLRTIQLGHVTLALSANAEGVRDLLAATKAEMQKMDATLHTLGKQVGTVSNTIGKAQIRTRAITRKLRGVEVLAAPDAEALLELTNEDALEDEEA